MSADDGEQRPPLKALNAVRSADSFTTARNARSIDNASFVTADSAQALVCPFLRML